MLAASFKRTKIIATIGPASNSYETIKQLIDAGANAIRLNMAHGTHEQHAAMIKLARRAGEELKRPVAVLADLQGPKIRVGDLPPAGIELRQGEEVTLGFGPGGAIPLQHDIGRYMSAGQTIYLKDGMIRLKTTKVNGSVITAVVEAPGRLMAHQGINLPETSLGGDILTDKDLADIEFACANDVDYLALSFVQDAQDIFNLKKRLNELNTDIAVIAKVETRAAAKELEAIMLVSDGVMVARGDLAVEVGPEKVPVLQRQIIRLARLHKKIAIVATQMLESMTDSLQPSRAEVSDIAGAVLQGADALMLSGETATGQYPVEVVSMMKRVITTTEESITKTLVRFGDQPAKENAISAAAITLAYQIGAKVIIAETSSGQTARNLASFRPPMPIVMVTHNRRVYQQLAIVWGGKSFLVEDPQGATQLALSLLKQAGNLKASDLVVVAAGNQPGVTGGTNRVEVLAVS